MVKQRCAVCTPAPSDERFTGGFLGSIDRLDPLLLRLIEAGQQASATLEQAATGYALRVFPRNQPSLEEADETSKHLSSTADDLNAGFHPWHEFSRHGDPVESAPTSEHIHMESIKGCPT